jgi:hypothetical protein
MFFAKLRLPKYPPLVFRGEPPANRLLRNLRIRNHPEPTGTLWFGD